jgi:erythromycin esterase
MGYGIVERAARKAALIRAVAALGLVCATTTAADESQETAFVEWAEENAIAISTTTPGSGFHDLMPLVEVIGDARVVGLGETLHGGRECNELKVRIFEFLVEKMGFTAFVMESGLSNGKLVYDYVLGADIDPEKVLWEGFSYGFGPWAETVALLDFMRAYNADPAHRRKIHFYGADPFAMGPFNEYRRTASVPLEAALAYLDRVDPEHAAAHRESLLPKIGLFKSEDEYKALEAEVRHAITLGTQALVRRFEVYRVPYIEQTSTDDYEWAYRHAIVARQVDDHYAFAATNPPRLDAETGREKGQADNVKWILEREGPEGRIVVWEHNGHVVKEYSESERFWIPGVGPFREIDGRIALLGLYLDSMLGDDYINFGFTNNRFVMEGEAAKNPFFTGLDDPNPAVEGSIDAALARVGVPIFALDLRSAPKSGPVNDWLTDGHRMRYQHMYMTLVPRKVWDGLIYIEEITPGQVLREGTY